MTVVLVVDDEDYIRRVLRRLLLSQGYEVLEARDGVEALGVLEEHAVDAAVVDLMMPRMDGFELLRRMQRDSPATKAVVISAVDQALELVEREPNVASVLKKPFELNALLRAVRSILGDSVDHGS